MIQHYYRYLCRLVDDLQAEISHCSGSRHIAKGIIADIIAAIDLPTLLKLAPSVLYSIS